MPARTFQIAVNPDGRRLATAAQDTTVRIWDPDRRVLLLSRGRTYFLPSLLRAPETRPGLTLIRRPISAKRWGRCKRTRRTRG